MIFTLLITLITFLVIVLLLVKCAKKNRRRNEDSSRSRPATVPTISQNNTRGVGNLRPVTSGGVQVYTPSAPPSVLVSPPTSTPTPTAPPSYEILFPNKPEFRPPPYIHV